MRNIFLSCILSYSFFTFSADHIPGTIPIKKIEIIETDEFSHLGIKSEKENPSLDFKATKPDPLKVVIDIKDTDITMSEVPSYIQSPIIKNIETRQYEKGGVNFSSVIIHLKINTEYDITNTSYGLKISLDKSLNSKKEETEKIKEQVDSGLEELNGELGDLEDVNDSTPIKTESSKKLEPKKESNGNLLSTEKEKTVSLPDLPLLESIDFSKSDNYAKLTIITNKAIEFQKKLDVKSKKLILELKNTLLSQDLGGELDSDYSDTNVLKINTTKGIAKTVKINLQLKNKTDPQILQESNVITVMIPNPTQEVEVLKSETSKNTPEEQPFTNPNFENYLTGDVKFVGRKIPYLVLKDADILDVFKLISEVSGFNIVAGQDVEGKVSLKLVNVPWDQALSVILQTKKLGYHRSGNILRIASLKTLKEEKKEAVEARDASRELEPLRVKIIPISYGKAKEFETQVSKFLTTRGTLSSDERTNSLIIKDIDKVIQKIVKLVSALDTQTPQVLIETKIIEATSSFTREIGVNWGVNRGNKSVALGSTSNSVSFTPTLSVDLPKPSNGLSAGFNFGNISLIGDLDARVGLAEADSKVKIISSPRVITLDKKEATITQGTQIPYVTTTQGSQGSAPQTTVIFKDVDLTLRVKPQITNEGSVIMEINVKRQFPDIQEGSTGLPGIASREAKTEVLVENGETTVIGGIYTFDERLSQSGVPFLRQLPFIGPIFQNMKKGPDTRTELMIFITPRILNADKSLIPG